MRQSTGGAAGTVALALIQVLAGCLGDDDGDGPADGAVRSSARGPDLCQAHLAWDMACAEQASEPRDEPYWGQSECPSNPWHLVQEAYLEATADCFSTLPCEGSDDACTAAGLSALGIESEEDVADNAELQRCMALARDCSELSDDYCLFFAVFTQAGRDQAGACLDLECGPASACLEDLD